MQLFGAIRKKGKHIIRSENHHSICWVYLWTDWWWH